MKIIGKLRWMAAFCAALPPLLVADDVQVAVASNFTPVLEQLALVFEAQTGHKVLIISGGTGQHYAQITNGAPFDVFLSADAGRPAQLEREGYAVAGSTFVYARGRLVLWSKDTGVVDAEGGVLVSGNFTHLALANPALAPYGLAAQEVLIKRGAWNSVQARIVQGDNIAQTLQFVQSGNAELGFIAHSQWLDADPDRTGSAWEVPAELHSPIDQQAVLLKDTPAARAFLAFLQSDSSKATIAAAGYEVP